MIDFWLLPGPAALVAEIVADLGEGRHCVIHGEAAPGLRLSLRQVLASQQLRLRSIFDDASVTPSELLQREGTASGDSGRLSPGVWWIDDVTPHRAPDWVATIGELAERQHRQSVPLGKRPLLVLPFAGTPPSDIGLGVAVRGAEPLRRVDLEVAARYADAAAGVVGLTERLRIEVAVELAGTLLPRFRALDELDRWMSAPDRVLVDPSALAEFAAVGDIDVHFPALVLSRIHQTVLLAEIERRRLTLVSAYRHLWKLPYEAVAAEGFPPMRITEAEFLELRYLCDQLRHHEKSAVQQVSAKMRYLRDIRNVLCHLSFSNQQDIRFLEQI